MKKIKIINGIGKYIDNNQQLKLGQTIKFCVELQNNLTKWYFIAYNNNEKLKGAIAEDGTFELPINFAKVGRLKIKLEERSSMELVKVVDVEDLIISELGGEMRIVPEIEELKEQVTKFSKIVEDLNKKYDTLLKLISTSFDIGENGDDN